jgi:hypothetical protein
LSHLLRVSGQCSGLICSTVDEEVFVPIALLGAPDPLDIRVGDTVQASVTTSLILLGPLWVQVKSANVAVRLNGLAPGVPITFWVIPPNPAFFTVTGATSGNLVLTISAPGTQVYNIQGRVDN